MRTKFSEINVRMYLKHILKRLFLRHRHKLALVFFSALALTSIVMFAHSSNRVHHLDVDDSMHETLLRYSDQACIHPRLKLFPPEFKYNYYKVPSLDCNVEENWVYVRNGTFRISEDAEKRHGKIVCEYTPFSRGLDDYTLSFGNPVKHMLNGTNIISDFFKVNCMSSSGRSYVNVHSGIAYNELIRKGLAQHSKETKNRDQYDILMIGLDSLSRMAWKRMLPKSHDFFTKQLGGIVLEGYNIVGDGTPQALLPILTGKSEEELPEARRGHANAQTVDEFPWIWKSFAEHGYVTQFIEDEPEIGAFHYRLLGFKNQPTDHYMRPFYIAAKEIAFRFHELCLGSVGKHLIFFNWIRDMYLMYERNPKFMFGFHSEISHEDNNKVQILDNDLKQLLVDLFESGSLDRTILILMADHGARFSNFRSSVQGKLEERMPHFGIRLPHSFDKYYPDSTKNLKINSIRLTTPFDIFATFQDILDFSNTRQAQIRERGISLLKEIPKERTCQDAGIEPHWCACLSWKNINVSESIAQKAAMATVNLINTITSKFRENCVLLKLKNVTRIMKYSTNSGVLKFRQSADHDGRLADLTGKMVLSSELYQVEIYTTPGAGHFEATVRYHLIENRFMVREKDISRINKYGNDPHCVMDRYPHLRPYCYCARQNDG